MKQFDINRAQKIHNCKYDYSLVKYSNVDTKVEIICPIHGLFEQTPYHHINRKQGCRRCKGAKISEAKRFSFQEYVEKANSVHKNRYTYPPQSPKNAHEKIIIICPIHGEFKQNFNNHIYVKNGCPSCGYNVSNQEKLWLKSLNIQNLETQKPLMVNGKKFKVDGFDNKTNTIYEFLGYFWHGHPDFFDPKDINPRNKKSYGELYQETLEKIEHLKSNGFNVVTKWG